MEALYCGNFVYNDAIPVSVRCLFVAFENIYAVM